MCLGCFYYRLFLCNLSKSLVSVSAEYSLVPQRYHSEYAVYFIFLLFSLSVTLGQWVISLFGLVYR